MRAQCHMIAPISHASHKKSASLPGLLPGPLQTQGSHHSHPSKCDNFLEQLIELRRTLHLLIFWLIMKDSSGPVKWKWCTGRAGYGVGEWLGASSPSLGAPPSRHIHVFASLEAPWISLLTSFYNPISNTLLSLEVSGYSWRFPTPNHHLVFVVTSPILKLYRGPHPRLPQWHKHRCSRKGLVMNNRRHSHFC